MKISGISQNSIEKISSCQSEPNWMLEARRHAYQIYLTNTHQLHTLGVDRKHLESMVVYDDQPYAKVTEPEFINQNSYSAKAAQHQSKIVYVVTMDQLKDKGVTYSSLSDAIKNYPDVVKSNFGLAVKPENNIFAALNTAIWSGGVFLYVPKNCKAELPVQALYYLQSHNFGQFERSLIVIDERAEVSFYEGCVAQKSARDLIHAGVVEIILKKNAKLSYTTIQNWSLDVENFVTKCAVLAEGASLDWIDGNIGSSRTFKYPSAVLMGDKSNANFHTFSFARGSQIQDAGAKVIISGSDCSSQIISKSVSTSGGANTFRGLVEVRRDAKRAKSFMSCDSIVVDDQSKANSIPKLICDEPTANIEHEAKISSIDTAQLLYLQSRGFDEASARRIIISGFIGDFSKKLNPTYVVELNKMLESYLN